MTALISEWKQCVPCLLIIPIVNAHSVGWHLQPVLRDLRVGGLRCRHSGAYGLLLSDGRIRRAKITNSFAFIEACGVHVGFFSEIWLLSDLVYPCTSDQTQNWKCCHGNQEQSRRRLFYDYIFCVCSLFPSKPFLHPHVSDIFFSSQREVILTSDELNTSLSYSYLRQTQLQLEWFIQN